MEIQGCVTSHYNFPIGVSTVGRVITPARGKEMIIATTTGTSSTNRVEGMVKNAISGISLQKLLELKILQLVFLMLMEQDRLKEHLKNLMQMDMN